jgi:hypothetical protein
MSIQGYNIAFKVNGKTLAGRTTDDLNISALTKESQTKDDGGNTNSVVTGHDVTFKAAGIMDAGSGENLGRDEILALALKTGDEAKIPVTYGSSSGVSYSGIAVITGYTESTSANGEATYSLDCKIAGAFSPAGA